MNVEELYAEIGGDYAEAKGRLSMDSLVERFVLKFVEDTSCADVLAAWEGGDERRAFEAAHRAKGVCANLALTRLAEITTTLCEALRPGNDELRAATDVEALVQELSEAHADTIAKLEAYRDR